MTASKVDGYSGTISELLVEARFLNQSEAVKIGAVRTLRSRLARHGVEMNALSAVPTKTALPFDEVEEHSHVLVIRENSRASEATFVPNAAAGDATGLVRSSTDVLNVEVMLYDVSTQEVVWSAESTTKAGDGSLDEYAGTTLAAKIYSLLVEDELLGARLEEGS